jgi:hypothetical protein
VSQRTDKADKHWNHEDIISCPERYPETNVKSASKSQISFKELHLQVSASETCSWSFPTSASVSSERVYLGVQVKLFLFVYMLFRDSLFTSVYAKPRVIKMTRILDAFYYEIGFGILNDKFDTGLYILAYRTSRST